MYVCIYIFVYIHRQVKAAEEAGEAWRRVAEQRAAELVVVAQERDEARARLLMLDCEVEAVRHELRLRDQELKRQAGDFPPNSPAVCTPSGTRRPGSGRAAAAERAGADGESPAPPPEKAGEASGLGEGCDGRGSLREGEADRHAGAGGGGGGGAGEADREAVVAAALEALRCVLAWV